MKFADVSNTAQDFSPLPRVLKQYLLTVIAVLAATLIRYVLGMYWTSLPPFIGFCGPILLVASLAGFWPGILATVLSSALASFLFLGHAGSPRSQSPNVVGLGIFTLAGVVICILADEFSRRSTRLQEFEKIVEGLDEMIAVVDRQYCYVIANRAFLKQRGLTQEQLVGRRAEDILGHELFVNVVKEKLGRAFQGEAVHFEMRFACPSFGERELSVSYMPVRGKRGIDRVACVLQDITEKKQAEEQLRQNEAKERARAEELEAILETLPIPLLISHDPHANEIRTNRAGREHFGLPPGRDMLPDVVRRPVPVRFFQDGVEVTREQMPMKRAVVTCAPVRALATKVVLPNGDVRHALGNAAPLFDEQGNVRGAVGATVDITALVETEEALRKSEEHFRILVEQAPQGFFIADAHGKYLDANSSGAEMLGYTREEVLKLNIADVVGPEEVDRIAGELRVLNAEKIVRSEWKLRRKDGSVFFGEVHARQLPDGRLQAILCDMTERKRAEEIVRHNEERFRVSLKGSPITVFNQDCDLRYTWVYNPQLMRGQEIIGKTDEELVGPEEARLMLRLKRRVLETGTSAREEIVLRQNGVCHAFDVTIEPLRDNEGKIVGITGASMDIARLRALADGLRDDKEQLAREKSYLEEEIQSELGFEQVIGQSPALREVLSKARVVAPTASTVLLLGETGTGKELVARSIHALSTRRLNNFIKLNCAAVPTGLLESELFGHEKGAFTGAVSLKVGRLELADKGTLFLDEIGELPPELQPKLLRVLQDREFERLGGVRTLHVDVRIISATNRDLQKEAAEKRFREDLFYRLNVFPIELPPLRERRGDIPMLIHHFVRKHAVRMGKEICEVSNETLGILQNWAWPGNIRELENVIERMVILTKGRVLVAPPSELMTSQQPILPNFKEMEREHLIRVLRETNGVLSGAYGAADRLGMKRTTLQSMLKRFNIHAEEYRRDGM